MTFTMPGSIPWTSTGVECTGGSALEITATGTVTDESDPSAPVTPDGLDDVARRQANLPALPDANALALVGRVGEDQPYFVIGSDFTGICPASGPLDIGLNDTATSGNGGSFEVTATMTPSNGVGNYFVEPVPGDSTWSQAAVTCEAGDRIHFMASGRVLLGGAPDRVAGPDGRPGDDASSNLPGLESAPPGALIGRFGDAPPFLIGSSSSVACPGGTEYWLDLALGINDAGPDVAYNTGTFTVAVVPLTETDPSESD